MVDKPYVLTLSGPRFGGHGDYIRELLSPSEVAALVLALEHMLTLISDEETIASLRIAIKKLNKQLIGDVS